MAHNKRASLFPMQRCKVIHLSRHAQGTHNEAFEKDKSAYTKVEYFDAPLTKLGWQQAQQFKQHNLIAHVVPQIVVTSPLSRCLQTAIAMYGGENMKPHEPMSMALMANGVALTGNPAISSFGAPPFIAVEWCREHFGVHFCDKRLPISILKKNYPAIDFSNIVTNEDTWWTSDVRESTKEIFERGRCFVEWLLDRQEQRIAVVAHSSFNWHFTHLFGEDCSPIVQKELQDGYSNCEMRSLILADKKPNLFVQRSPCDFVGGSIHYVSKE
jgi:broad specificity phosphatase PhoE